MNRTVLALVAALTVTWAQAGPVNGSSAALSESGRASAVSLLQSQAEAGDAYAQFRLGSMYYRGEGVGQDYVQALEWATRGAVQGSTEAMYLTGNILLYGPGDSEAAARDAAYWYAAAAGRGHAEAQYALGLLYFTGKGVPEDREKALRWFERAAGNGYREARLFVAQKPCND